MKVVEIPVDKLKSALGCVSWCIKLYDDGRYWTTDYAGLLEILSEWLGSKRSYVADRFDCDDFSRLFKCFCIERYGINAVGLVRDYLMRHAYILFVTDELNVFVVEPQNGAIWTFDERPRGNYLCKFALITF